MFYEEEVTSFPELMRRVRVLDQDAGIRLIGRSGTRRFLVFVTRFGSRFTLMRYSVRGGSPGKRLQVLEVDDAVELERVLKGLAGRRVRAWIY
jgi:hypothetical protein